jgi:hypothetical protein
VPQSRDDRNGRIPVEHTSRDYAELAIWTYRKSRALGNWLGVVSGSASGLHAASRVSQGCLPNR